MNSRFEEDTRTVPARRGRVPPPSTLLGHTTRAAEVCSGSDRRRLGNYPFSKNAASGTDFQSPGNDRRSRDTGRAGDFVPDQSYAIIHQTRSLHSSTPPPPVPVPVTVLQRPIELTSVRAYRTN